MFYYNNVHIKLGDGIRTNFWKDYWCNNHCFKVEFPILYRLVLDKEKSLRSLYDRSVASGNWNFQFRRRLYEWEEREVSKLKVLLPFVFGLYDDLEDKLVWLAADSGLFSVSSAYRSEVVSLGPPLNTCKLIWNRFAPPTVEFFCWLAWKNRVKSAKFL